MVPVVFALIMLAALGVGTSLAALNVLPRLPYVIRSWWPDVRDRLHASRRQSADGPGSSTTA
ncbi:MAG: hypothetical protein WKF75_15650 [Singulisphaera sp.]